MDDPELPLFLPLSPTTPDLPGVGDRTQDFKHARWSLYPELHPTLKTVSPHQVFCHGHTHELDTVLAFPLSGDVDTRREHSTPLSAPLEKPAVATVTRNLPAASTPD